LHHVVLERWSRGASFFHARDPRAKILVALVFLVSVATTPMISPWPAVCYGFVLMAAGLIARLPLTAMAVRSAVVLPFSAIFAIMTFLAGNGAKAAELVQKSYFSALIVLLLLATTPLTDLLRGLESVGVPAFLLTVIQFLYRYLFVVSEQAQHMRLAAGSRGSFLASPRRARHWLRAAGGALAVLFARSYLRAEGIHRAMLARGFRGRFPAFHQPRFRVSDGIFSVLGIALLISLRWILQGSAQ